ncbi:glycosyltransferase family 2 protein [Mycobacterium sp. NPDC048908]|uniref:glycosyltransferase family 2 protein n=1 Tax=Mycobacterium sp. NPDC048908 TaxID=3364292 RepID=UPI003715A924
MSVVIPTIGRASLRTAVESVLNQTAPPGEIIVVVDRDCEPDLPDFGSIRVLRTAGGEGPSIAKDIGVAAAKGDVIALLDDDDVWRLTKLEKQLAAVPPVSDWIVSCRYAIHRNGRKPVTYPQRLIHPRERIAPYLFEMRSMPPREHRWLVVPSLVFPRELAQRVPWSVSAGSIHDDPKWQIEVQRALPGLEIVQIPDVLVDVIWTPNAVSVSRPGVDRSWEYIDWGIRELADESKRVMGDYMLTEPVTSAMRVGSFRGVTRSIAAGVRSGRPGLFAWIFAVAALVRVGWRQVKAPFSSA